MGQQPSIQQPSTQQPDLSVWDMRARGGCDLDAITTQIRREFGLKGIGEVEKKIYYLQAHGSYRENETAMVSIPPGITIIHFTTFSSQIWTNVMGDIKRLPTEKKIASFLYPNCRRNIEYDMEKIADEHPPKPGTMYREDKSWGNRNQVRFLINQVEVPNIGLNFCGETDTPREVRKKGESDFFKTGLTQRRDRVSKLDIKTDQHIGSMSTDNKEYVEKLIKQLLFPIEDTYDESQQNLINFFINRLYSGQYETISDLMRVHLSDLFDNNLIPQGFIFMLSCRSCRFEPTQVSFGGVTGQSVYEKDFGALSMGPLIDAPLDDICSQLPCHQRIRSLDPTANYEYPHAVCKTSGYFCSVCNDAGYCVSCIDSNSVVILPNGKMHERCSMCFTIEELLEIGKYYYFPRAETIDETLGLANLPTEFVPNPIFPSDCKIDSRIIKFCLALMGNPNQVIFYGRAISTDQQFTQALYIILCFRYIDFNKYLLNFGREVVKIGFTNAFLSNNTIAEDFVKAILLFNENGEISNFLATTDKCYNYMLAKEYE